MRCFFYFYKMLLRWLSGKSKPYDMKKFLIVGLGNIGSDYKNTRHNIGFEVIDYLAKKHETDMEEVKLCKKGTFRYNCLLYTSPSPRDVEESRMPSSA